MKVLALDVATITGCAIGVTGGAPTSWEVDLGDVSDRRKFARMIEATTEICAAHRPELVIVEAPIGGGRTNHVLVGLWACAMGAAVASGVRKVEKADTATVRKHFLGKHLTTQHFPGMRKGDARLEIKRAVIARCRSLGWDVENDNEADASAIWDYACSTHDPAHHITTIGGLFK